MTKPLVLQTDFGLCDGAVAAMNGVAISVDPALRIFNLTHEIPPYHIWEASYRLYQTISYWPADTVFVSVVDPGVGSDRRSIAAKAANGQYIITPDNGTLTHMKDTIVAAREIDETINRLPHSEESYTFHGRDVYAYTGAKLAAGVIRFEEIGPEIPAGSIIELPRKAPELQDGVITGTIDTLDVRFGNLWTNIDSSLFRQLDVNYGDSFEVTIFNESRQHYKNIMTFGHSFADSHIGEPLLYINSLYKLGIAINQGSFAKAYHIDTGIKWNITIRKAPKIVYQK
ncbi:SAM hydrolase/SAM-dependent halogenase family protein [Heyndrickxia coagulans]|uniref:S-adenosyl-l-methionine hydroxide adenosyltransferase family protein n=1 Tax=Heyndrickxia coagulans TaxID=1398 RepID=A0AAW7CII7_HEYCO|nr:S-adenosyl-l-methionine hydroxide adenosyltransferase family protein [Heyndrickxia coagulans]MDL5039861.1 S-adenosyl-l-methionine hydroxide adenosyltransferase family protein [Heyndrickxia coagulans]